MTDHVIVITVANNGFDLHGTRALLHNRNHIPCLDIAVNHLMELSEAHASQLRPVLSLAGHFHQCNES